MTPGLNRSLALGLALAAAAPGLGAAGDNQPSEKITAVASKASADYVRVRVKGGGYAPEYYAFGEGGHYAGPMHDASLDGIGFMDVARTIAVPLAEQNYLPARDPAKTRLLIMVYWGLTYAEPPISSSSQFDQLARLENNTHESASATRAGFHSANTNNGMSDEALDQLSVFETIMNIENQQRAHQDFINASLLGYDVEDVVGTDYSNNIRGGPLAIHKQELADELEHNRYFVVLMAYDFQLLWKQKKHKLLWETRFSVSQNHNQFDRDLAAMAKAAEAYFGQNSGGLIHKPVPVGTVEIGPLRTVDEPRDK